MVSRCRRGWPDEYYKTNCINLSIKQTTQSDEKNIYLYKYVETSILHHVGPLQQALERAFAAYNPKNWKR